MRKRLCFILFALSVVLSAKAQNDTVVFSALGGFYEDVLQLELYNSNPQYHIRYTTNGNRPTAQSPLYEGALVLDERLYSKSDIYTIVNCLEQDFYLPDSVQHCIVIRAAVFDENDSCVSRVMTNSYFIQALGCNTHGLPAVSLCADSLDLFSYYRGIFVPGAWQSPSMPEWTGNYFCKGEEWERRCNVEFYENENRGVNQEAGLRAHGGASRRYQQKGMKLYAREEYGEKRFKHRFFDDIPIDNVKRMNLKPFRCSNWLQIGLNDALSHRVARQLDVDVFGSRAVVVFLNGEYWGIYYLEEATDTHYLEDHYGVEPDSCNIIKNWRTLDEGDDTEWWELYEWLESADLTQAEDYDYLCSKIDLHNFIDYTVFELYSANVDWPANNVRCWQTGNRKWRWMFYDGDGCFFREWDVFANIVDTSNNLGPSNAASTLFYRRLLKNEDFVTKLRSRFETLMASRLTYDHTGPILAALSASINDEIPNQSFRFRFPTNTLVWTEHLDRIETFLQERNQIFMAQIDAFLSVFSHEISVGYMAYPNPFNDEIHLLVSSEQWQTQDVEVFDLLGRCVYHDTLRLFDEVNHFVIRPDLTAGVYILKIGSQAVKIVKR